MDYKTNKDILGAIYITISLMAIGFLIYINTIDIEEPISQRDDYIDNIMDSVDMDCGSSDEYRMWIGSNGDTIWE